MFFTEEKLARRIAALSPLRYRQALPATSLEVVEDPDRANGARPPGEGAAWHPVPPGWAWEGTDRYLWLRARLAVPPSGAGQPVVGLFDFGRTGDGSNDGFEALLFIDGEPWQGVDTNHREVLLPEGSAGRTLTLHFRLWSGLGGMDGYHSVQRHALTQAEVAVLDRPTDDLFFTADVALGTVHVLPESDPAKPLILAALTRSLGLLDWREGASGAFYASAEDARDALHVALDAMAGKPPVTIHVLGHTHIDVAWLWRLAHTREKAARSFATVLRLMEHYPEFVFFISQPQLLAYLKEDYPELFAALKQRVAEGRIELGGGMWLEADCNIPSGESLVRQVLFGSRFLEDEFGVSPDFLWLPDVFGYSWALPQIMVKSGLRAFMTTKISWNQYNRLPHDTFWWRGMDGSTVLAHFITTPSPAAPPASWRSVYEADMTVASVVGIWEKYRDKAVTRHLLMAYGFGDGGGGVNRDMLERRRRIDAMPALPLAVPDTAKAYFERLRAEVASTDAYVHTWDGELYLEYHRGTYTSQAPQKKRNRRLELALRDAEWLSVAASLASGDPARYPEQDLHRAWEILLRNQFHDIIPGSSIHEVYEDSQKEYDEADGLVGGVLDGALSTLVAPDERCAVVVNPASWETSGPVVLPVAPGTGEHIEDAEGREVVTQATAGGTLAFLSRVLPMGLSPVRLAEGSAREAPIPFTDLDRGVETPFYRLGWNGAGELVSIWDRRCQREVLAAGAPGNVLEVYEDKPLRFDAWDIDLFHREKRWPMERCTEARIVETGPLRCVVRFGWTYRRSSVNQDMVLYAHSRRIDFVTTVDWHEHQQLLKVAFPVAVRNTEATFDVQFGNVRRPTHHNTSWDWARFETVGHQWADLSEAGYGVSLLNDCKYGHDVHDGVLRLSLVKSAVRPDRVADEGVHRFTYALYPHEGGWLEGGTVAAAFALNAPLRAVSGRCVCAAPPSLLRLSSPHVAVDALKRAEDGHGIIVRLHDFSGGRHTVVVTPGFPISSWHLVDLMERPLGGEAHTKVIELTFGPYEIHTMRLVPA